MIFQIPNLFEQLLALLRRWDFYLSGLLTTLWLYGWALLIGFFLGLMLAILRQYGGMIFSRIATGYIEIIRGTPLLAQLLLLYFLPYAMGLPIGTWALKVSLTNRTSFIFLNHGILIAILTLGLNSAAYQAEYLRGAIVSVGSEQLIAAQSLGMSRLAGIRRVVLPQALRRVIPAWSNEASYLPKYTVVVYFVGVLDLFGQAYSLGFATFAVIPSYIIIAIIYLILISLISKGLDTLYKRIAIPGL
ncbi:MAG: amino acid ABC transporter permease [Candidatus Thorarchaeota archaeon]